jgi:hypothetical protein
MNWIIIRINPAVDCKSISISKNHIHWIYNPLYAKILKTRIRIVDMWINPEPLMNMRYELESCNTDKTISLSIVLLKCDLTPLKFSLTPDQNGLKHVVLEGL